MQYIVQVSGDVLERKEKVYVVSSDSAEDAQSIARKDFCNEYSVDIDNIRRVSTSANREKRAIVAIVLMVLSILLAFVNWKVGHDTVSIRPDLVSCAWGALLYSCFVLRFKGIKGLFNSWVDAVSSVAVILLLATFVKIILREQQINIFGLFSINANPNLLLIVTVLLSLCEIKLLSFICLLGIGVYAIGNITLLSEAMHPFWGIVFFICAFIGILLYLSVEPVCFEAIREVRGAILKFANHVNDGAGEMKKFVANGKERLAKKKGIDDGNNNNQNLSN